MAQYRVQLGNLTLLQKLGVAAVVALGLAAAVALVVVSIGVAIVLLPVVAVALVIGRWRLNKMMERAQRDRPTGEDGRTIEIEYSVIDGEKRR